MELESLDPKEVVHLLDVKILSFSFLADNLFLFSKEKDKEPLRLDLRGCQI